MKKLIFIFVLFLFLIPVSGNAYAIDNCNFNYSGSYVFIQNNMGEVSTQVNLGGGYFDYAIPYGTTAQFMSYYATTDSTSWMAMKTPHSAGQCIYSASVDNTIIPTIIPNGAPVVTVLASQTTLDEGNTFIASGSFTDGDSISWTGIVNYGDGTGDQILQLNSDKTFLLSHAYIDNGTYQLIVTVTDDQGAAGTATGIDTSIIVTNPAPVIALITPPAPVDQNAPIIIPVSFSDYANNIFTAAVDWGDGNGAQPVQVSGTDVSLNHSYLAAGTYTITIFVTDDQGATTIKTFTITVKNVSPIVGEITVSATPIQINTSISTAAPFTDPGVLDTHTAIWDWGDGSSATAGVVTEANGTGTVSGTHTYSTAGDYTITLTVTDNNGGADTGTATVTVYAEPTDKDQCKKDGWKSYLNLNFKNQGDCVSYIATHGKNPPGGN